MKQINRKFNIIVISFFFIIQSMIGQEFSYYENNQFNPFARMTYTSNTPFHTSIKNYKLNDVEQLGNLDSAVYANIRIPNGHLNFWKRIFHDHLLMWNDTNENVSVSIDPLFNFEFGQEKSEGKKTFVNTRGVMTRGHLGDYVGFYADFVENQASFPNYVQEFIEERNVVPGQGRTKNRNLQEHDYSQSTGYLSADFYKFFTAQLGYGKNFIGDGYRSLLLSDNAFSYPYFKLQVSFMKVKYQIMWAQTNLINIDSVGKDLPFTKKWGVYHYLDWNIGKRFTLGLFENVTWADETASGKRGFDFSYAIPMTVLRPVEYANGSPDKVLVGLNTKLILWKNATFYAQGVLNEFRLQELTAGSGWWANKYGYQLGFKQYNFLGAKNLDVQVEYNTVMPFTYSSPTGVTSYSHHNQELAHPYGANFKEIVSIVNYRYKRIFLQAQITAAKWGEDSIIAKSWGKNVLKPNELRYSEYNNYLLQGVPTDMFRIDGSISYLINPRNNFNIVLGCNLRNFNQPNRKTETEHFYFAIRTTLKNHYYDF